MTERDSEREYESAFPDDGEGQLGEPVVDEQVRDGLDNAADNAQVNERSTRDADGTRE